MFERTFSPIRIAGVEIPNRILRSAHGTGISKSRLPGEDSLIAYHLARAKDGVGLTVLEGASVHPSSSLADLIIWDDSVIPQYQRMVRAIKPTGMKLFQQLWLGGHSFAEPTGKPSWATSTIQGRYATGAPPIAMTTEQIQELIEAYAVAAARVEAGGLDGVEFHAAHGYLVSQFLSPLINNREDEYGGSAENRRRFVIESLRAIRAATSPGFAVGIRISESSDPKGFTTQDANALCRILEAEKLIDFVNISHSDYYAISGIIGAMDKPAGYELATAGRIGEGLGVPKMVVGRFGTLDDIEQVLRSGEADMVGMVRAAIADPKIITKSRAGRAHEVRPCIGCNQGCLGGVVLRGQMGCTVNPAVGYEATLSEDLITRTATPKHVFIVGGGPAGMEAARVAALRGHRVTLAEAAPTLGGMINYARRMPKLHGIGDITAWLEAEVYRLGVEVRLSTYIDSEDIEAENPDVLIIATGSARSEEPIRQSACPSEQIRIAPGAQVLDSLALLDSRPRELGKSAVVVDDIGHYEAIGCCEELMTRGLDVTYVTRLPGFVPMFEAMYRIDAALKRLHALGRFRIGVQSVLVSVDKGSAEIRPIYSDKTETIPADVVVCVDYRQSANQLWHGLRNKADKIHLIGDALSPRDLQTAIREGHIAARDL